MSDRDIDTDTVPDWSPGVRTRHDDVRDRWMILGPERIVVPEGSGGAIARLVDGDRSIDDIITRLVDDYDADRATIADETIRFLRQLAQQGYLEL